MSFLSRRNATLTAPPRGPGSPGPGTAPPAPALLAPPQGSGSGGTPPSERAGAPADSLAPPAGRKRGAGLDAGAAIGLADRGPRQQQAAPRTRARDPLSHGTGAAPAGLRVYTVLVADDAPSTRRALAELLEDTSDLVCVAAVADASSAIAQAAHYQPDVAVLDVLMPGGGGLAAAVGIREVSPRTRMLAYSAASDRASVVQMLRSGARGYLVKGSPAQDLLAGLRRCAEGATALSEGLSDHLVAEMGEQGRAERAFSAAARARYERLYKLLQPGVSCPTYQPVVHLRTGQVAGYEALTDFTREPSYSTEDIFREAHHVGLGVELELHTARLAVDGFQAELARCPDTYLAVNASPGLLYRPALLEVLSQLPPARVVVEITEQRQFDSYDQLRETVCLVHERGMRVAVDDTGSGFAGLQRLVDVRPEIVKLDRALTSEIDTDPPRRALVTAMRQFADDMGIVVVAEGIEREEQLVVLRDIGIDCGQGYLLGRPAPMEA